MWSGAGALGSDDGWVVLSVADRAGLLLPPVQEIELSPTAVRIRNALADRGALFFRQIGDEAGLADDAEMLLSIWELVWAGVVTNDTLAPIRGLAVRGRSSGTRRARPRRGPAFPSRLGPPSGAGRWSLVPPREESPTRRMHALAEQLLSRHGIVTRGAAMAEHTPGGFGGVYPILKMLEASGKCRRGYFVDGLGGAQFALPGAVDRMRSLVEPVRSKEVGRTHVIAACDPANPYGAALPWPEREVVADRGRGHRPGRKVGAIVVMVDGHLVLYVERGGRTLLSFSDDDDDVLELAVNALALAAREGALGKLSVEKADGDAVADTPLAQALEGAGFRPTSRGLRLRA